VNAHTSTQMLWNIGFLLATYGPLQVAAIWRQTGSHRVAAAAPLLVMVPMIVAAALPSSYADGSLFGMYYFVPYLPAMLYLIVAVLNVPRSCQQCGRPVQRRSFQSTPPLCPDCLRSKTR